MTARDCFKDLEHIEEGTIEGVARTRRYAV